MNTKELTEFLKNNEFNVRTISEPDNTLAAEIETWTKRGVNMITHLSPFTVESFQEYVESFDIDDEIDVHRQNERYREDFTLRQSLEDFEDFEMRLRKMSEELNLNS